MSGTDQKAFEEINRRYQIEKIYHSGQHYRILQAYSGQRKVAIHIPHSNTNAQQSSTQWARLLRGLKHPGLPIYIEDFSTVNGTVMVTEWIEGRSLEQLFREGLYRHTEHFSVRLLEQAARVMTYLHGLRPPIVHSATGPKNWFLDDKDRMILIGFSNAHDDPRRAAEMTQDVFELAQTGLLLVTGLRYDELSSDSVSTELENLQLSRPLAQLLAQGLDPAPENRPSASQFLSRISELLAPLAPEASDISFTQVPSPIESSIRTTPVELPQEALEPLELHSPSSPAEISIDTITISEEPKVSPGPTQARNDRLKELWQTIKANPSNTDSHDAFAKFSVESGQYQEAAELYRGFETEFPKFRELGEKYRQDIAIKAASRIIAAQPRMTNAPLAVSGFAKWSLIGSSAGLVVAMMLQNWVIAIMSGPVFAFALWARFRGRSGG